MLFAPPRRSNDGFEGFEKIRLFGAFSYFNAILSRNYGTWKVSKGKSQLCMPFEKLKCLTFLVTKNIAILCHFPSVDHVLFVSLEPNIF